VKKLYVKSGARVRAGQLLLELEDRDLAGAAAESRASLDLAEATFETTANATIPQELLKAELDTRVEVWVEAENNDGQLRPGSSLRVEMIARTVPNALVIPQSAVLTSPAGSTFAIVVDNDNKPHLRKITAGIRDKGSVQVTDGLQSGQRVATTGAFELFKLEPEILSKTKVQIAPAKEEEEPEES
jgi:multidrug efflux pump subunit AcrA (membrane-fusion protein)